MAAVIYAADGPFPEQRPGYSTRWRSPIHMPRWASRLTLEITGVRVERVQDITDRDALAEGCTGRTPAGLPNVTAREVYRKLWDALNAKRGYSWDSNPWVWVISFRPLEASR